MGKRRQPKSEPTDVEYEERIRQANVRTVALLGTVLAQDASILTMGTALNTTFQFSLATGENLGVEVSVPTIDRESLGYLATQIRPFQLEQEPINYEKVVEGLVRFAAPGLGQEIVGQLSPLWKLCARDRLSVFSASTEDGEQIPGGVGDTRVADRVLYSQIVHADDASELLDHVPLALQQWSLASFVGNWTAMLAHQQVVAHFVRPDLVPEVTAWAGDSSTIFKRLGVEARPIKDH